jgi:hypothetical protein
MTQHGDKSRQQIRRSCHGALQPMHRFYSFELTPILLNLVAT